MKKHNSRKKFSKSTLKCTNFQPNYLKVELFSIDRISITSQDLFLNFSLYSNLYFRGGNGRTGMFLAAYLMRRDSLSASASIAAVRATRPHSIESGEQVDSLKELEQFLDQKE